MLLHPTLKRTLPATLAILITFGCTTGPSKEELKASQLEAANQLIQAGDYHTAADEFLKLAEASPEVLKDDTPSNLKQVYQLTAADAYIRAGDSLTARKVLDIIDTNKLDAGLNNRLSIANAGVAELEQEPEIVLNALQDLNLSSLSNDDQRLTLAMRIAAQEGLGHSLQAAQSRSLIDPLLGSQQKQDHNRRAIWSTIDKLDQAQKEASNFEIQQPLAGWIELNELAKRSVFDASLFSENVNAWRESFPNHAAETPVLEELFAKSEALGKKIKTVALLLPNSGRFAQASAAIRDGFLAAWYGENDQREQPMVHVYQADSNNILDAYQRAIDEGVDLVVGPLEKTAIQTLLSLPELPIKTLALNQLTDAELTHYQHHIESNHFYQFGLPPEQEAAQVAARAWAAGYRHALAITPEGQWGERLYTAFKTQYETLGGVVVDHQSFPATDADYSAIITRLLNIDASEDRYQQLTTELNRRLQFEPRPRKDLDFIFMAAQPVQARQIRPQLLFHRASSIPVFTTSHAFGLPPRGEPDLDLEGVIIGDMPWMIKNQTINAATPLSIQQNWPDDNAAFLRLFALGVDAYNIIPHLGRLRVQVGGEFKGETGDIYLNQNAQVQRELTWAKFQQGKPALIELDKTTTQPILSNSEN